MFSKLNIFKSKSKEPIELSFSTDIHCHIIPGVDDGSPDAATSADLIERMQKWGLKRIFASPHVTQITFENTKDTIAPAIEQLRNELATRNNGILLDHAAEYRIDDNFRHYYELNDLMKYPNDYVLIENAFLQEPWGLDELVFDMQIKGLRPILAHPERYAYYYCNKKRYKELHDAGIAFQINLLSLAGHYGKYELKFAEHLLKMGLVDFVGTDLHNSRHADAIDQYLTTSNAKSHMADLAQCVRNDSAF